MFCSSVNLSGQNISNLSVEYDNDFNAIATVTVSNNSSKKVTAIKITIVTNLKSVGNENSFLQKDYSSKFECNISPNDNQKFRIPVKLDDNYEVRYSRIEAVRYSDGTIR